MTDFLQMLVDALDPEEVWSCDVGLVLKIDPNAKAFFVAIADRTTPPIDGVQVMVVSRGRFAKHAFGSPLDVALKTANLVYRKRTEPPKKLATD